MARSFAPLITFFLIFLAACAPQDVAVSESETQNLPARRAYFATNPETLHSAFRAVCESPGDKFSQPDRYTATCRFLPSPDVAAYLLTRYDGKLEAPKLVMQKITRPRSPGVEIEISYYAEVVQQSGKLRRVYTPSRALDRRIDKLLKDSGGQRIN